MINMLGSTMAIAEEQHPAAAAARGSNAPPGSATTVPEAATTTRELPAVRLSPAPVIDGDLSDPCWQQAARADRFTDALFGNLVPDQTVATLGYDDQNLYVAFHCYDSQPQGIVARETKRGAFLRGDDRVSFTIDPFHAHRFADRSWFQVNPIGTQFAHLATGRATKLEWEGKWRAAGKTVADGWVVEMAIPWSILNYPTGKGPVTCGINFDRWHQRTQTTSWWSNIGPQELYEYEGHWIGIRFPPFRPQLSLLPYVSPGWEEKRGAAGRSGLDARAALTPSLTLVGTVNPDFRNVEGAVEGIDFSYGERFVQERRPFFLEGANVYQTGNLAGRLFYSRRIGDFDTGLNLYGKITPRDTLGVLAAVDLGHRIDWLMRGRHDFGITSGLDYAFINRDDERLHNRVLFLGPNVRKGLWSTGGTWVGSWLDDRHAGDIGTVFLQYQSPRVFVGIRPHYVRPGFRDDLGFVSFTDYKGVSGEAGYNTEWRKGPIRSFGIFADARDERHYDGRTFRRQQNVFADFATRSDLGFSLSWERGRFEEFDDSVLGLSWRARVSDPFHNFGVGYSWGRRADAHYQFLTPFVTWRFGEKTTLGLSSSILHHTENLQQHVVTFNYDFSPRQGIGARIVSQTGGTNGYLAFRRSGYGGVETFLILGDPNTRTFRKRIVLKVVWPM